MQKFSIERALGMPVLILGLAVMSGWWIKQQILVQIVPGFVAMVFNTALCFAISGATILIPGSRTSWRAHAELGTGIILIIIAGLSVLQNMMAVDFGIDELFVSVWLTDPNPHPGRMAPLTSTGFILAGVTFLLMHRLRLQQRAQLAIQVLALAIVALGLCGLIGYTLKLELIYGWYRFVRMAPHTAAGFLMMGLALWTAWYQILQRSGAYENREDRRISALATIILLIMALTAGLGGFVLSTQRTELSLKQNLDAARISQAKFMQFVITDGIHQSEALGSDPDLISTLRDAKKGIDIRTSQQVALLTEHLLSDTLSAIAVYAVDGRLLLTAGDFDSGVRLQLPLRAGVALLWGTQSSLQVTYRVVRNGEFLGTIATQRRLPVIDGLLTDATLLGKTGDIALCTALDQLTMRCLPTRFADNGFTTVGRQRDGQKLPMSYALDGFSGLAVARDYRGKQVVAAYGPIAGTTLGLVIKMDATELYAPIRSQLEFMFGLLAILIVSGLALLRWQLIPLVTTLLAAKRNASTSETKVRAIVDNVADGLITINEQSTIESMNPAAAAMFGYDLKELVNQPLEMLIPASLRPAHNQGMRRYLDTGESCLVGRAPCTVQARRKDGTEFPMQLAVREMQLDGQRLFVGIVRDITEQQKAEQTSARFNAFMDATPHLVAFADEHLHIIQLNPAGRMLLGLSHDDDMHATPLASICAADALQLTFEQVLAEVRQHGLWRGEQTLLSTSGQRIPVSFSILCTTHSATRHPTYSVIATDIHEEKLAQQALAASETKYRTLFDSNLDGIVFFDMEGHCCEANDAYARMHGYTREEMLTLTYQQISAKKWQALDQDIFESQLLVRGYSEEFEKENMHKNGTPVPVSVKAWLAYDADGKPRGYWKIVRDISERFQAEQQMKSANERYHFVSRATSDVVWDWDFVTNQIGWNDQITMQFGYALVDVDADAHWWVARIHPDDKDRVVHEVDIKIEEGDEFWSSEYRFIKANGDYAYIYDRGYISRTSDGKATRMIGAMMDITDRKRAELALQQSEEKYRSIVETTKDWIWSTDRDGNLNYSNAAVERILGYGAQELAGIQVTSLIHSDDREQVMQNMQLCQAEKKGWSNWMLRYMHKDGSERYLQSNAVPIFNEYQAIVGYRGTDHDVTALKQYERQLQDEKNKAEAANQAKTDFLANMSHEIRTPMNAIVGAAELLSDMELNNEQQQYVKMFRSAADSLLTLLNQILDLSKIEAGQLQLEAIPFNLIELLDSSCETLSVRAHKKGLELVGRVAPGTPVHLVGDPLRLRQILLNLIGNAIKFTNKGQIVVDAGVADMDAVFQESRVGVRFSITDSGVGIPAGSLQHIFERFTQVDSSITRQYGGTGLGLSISKHLVEQMGGDIQVVSEIGKGSTFTFTVYLKYGAEIEHPVPTHFSLEGKRILVVDDTHANRVILREKLLSWGAQVAEANDGQDALRQIDRAEQNGKRYDLTILDQRMPHMDGLSVAEALRAQQRLSDNLVMMLTSDDSSDSMMRAREVGIEHYLVKPIRSEALQRVMQDALAKTAPMLEPVQSVPEIPVPQGAHVLVVDDSDFNRLLVQAFFSRTTCILDMASNGQEAIDKFRAGQYDVILMDIQMPVLDGYSAVRKIREIESTQELSRTPIFAVTAYAQESDMQKSVDVGCDGHLTKPLTRAALFGAVCQALAKDGQNSRTAHDPKMQESLELAQDAEIMIEVEPEIRELLPAFIDAVWTNIDAIQHALSNDDFETVRVLAHRMKGEGSAYGLAQVSEIGRTLEDAARSKNAKQANDLVCELSRSMKRVRL